MPELPEVEHVRRMLSRWVAGATIRSCRIDDARLVRPARPNDVVAKLEGRRIATVERRGKWIRIRLDGPTRLFVHLGMTGWLEAAPSEEPLRFERARLVVTRGARTQRVAYVDARRWGRWVASDDDIAAWSSLGPDPLHDGLDAGVLAERLARRSRSIKEALLDQTVIAGIGNIQAIEALWKARIDPRSVASAVPRRELGALVRGIEWSIARTLDDWVHGDAAHDPFLVYGRAGTPCRRCGTKLDKLELGGRTTTFCPGCQRQFEGAATSSVTRGVIRRATRARAPGRTRRAARS